MMVSAALPTRVEPVLSNKQLIGSSLALGAGLGFERLGGLGGAGVGHFRSIDGKFTQEGCYVADVLVLGEDILCTLSCRFIQAAVLCEEGLGEHCQNQCVLAAEVHPVGYTSFLGHHGQILVEAAVDQGIRPCGVFGTQHVFSVVVQGVIIFSLPPLRNLVDEPKHEKCWLRIIPFSWFRRVVMNVQNKLALVVSLLKLRI